MAHPNNHRGNLLWLSKPLCIRKYAYDHRSTFSIVLIIVALGTFACYGALSESGSVPPSVKSGGKTEDDWPEQAINTFVALAQQNRIDKIVLYYRNWENLPEYSVPEETLFSTPDLKVTLVGTMIQKPVLALARTLDKSLRYRRTGSQVDEKVDFGIGVTYYSNEKEVIRVSISKRPPILSVNGKQTRLLPELLSNLKPLLPSMIDEGMFLYIVSDWVLSEPWILDQPLPSLADWARSRQQKNDDSQKGKQSQPLK